MKSFYLHAWNLTLEMPYGYCLGRYTLCWGLQGSSSVVCRSHAATSARCKQCLKHFLWTVWCTSQSPLRLGHYSHLILDEGIGTKSSLVLRNQGLDFWPQSSCPWPCKAICTSHGPADGCICSFPSEKADQCHRAATISCFPHWGMMETDVPEEPICLPSEWVLCG